MTSLVQPWKRPEDAFLAAVTFATWPLQPGEQITPSNARGVLGVVAMDTDGVDVSAEIVEMPQIIGTESEQVAFVIKGGTAGASYWITVTAPTTGDELLTSQFVIEVRDSFRAVA